MDDGATSISPDDLYARLGLESAPTIIDIRPEGPDREGGRMIVSAVYCALDEVEHWSTVNPDRHIVVYCRDGLDISQSVATALRAFNIDAFYLQGGIDSWIETGFPTRRVGTTTIGRWVTRERPKVDRIACPWLIRRFINPRSFSMFLPSGCLKLPKPRAPPLTISRASSLDIEDHCSFDAIVSGFDINDPALDHLALIVRGADTSRSDLAPQCPALLALSRDLSSRFAGDYDQLKHGMIIYDAFYQWCRLQQEILGRTRPLYPNGVIH